MLPQSTSALLLFCLLSFQLCFANGDIDSLKSKIEKTTDDSIKIDLLYRLGRKYSLENDNVSANKTAETLLAFTKEKKLIYGQGLANELFGLIIEEENPAKSVIYYNNALSLFQKINYRAGVAAIYNDLGISNYGSGNFEEALNNYNKSLAIYDSLNDATGQANVYNGLAGLYHWKGEYRIALDYLGKALENYRAQNNEQGITNAYLNIASSYVELKQSADALLNYNKAIQLMNKTNDQTGLAIAYSNIGSMYIDKKDFDSAQIYVNKTLKIANEINDPISIVNAYFNLSEINLYKKNLPLARKYVDTVITNTKTMKLLPLYAEGMKLKVRIDSAAGDYKKAYFDFQEYIILKDSILSEEKSRELTRLGYEYQFNKAQDSIRYQYQLQQSRQEKEIIAKNKERNLLIVTLAGLLLISLLVYRNYRTQKKSNGIIVKEKQRSDELLLNILPEEVAEELKEKGSAQARSYSEVTVLFTDFTDFTRYAEKMGPEELINELHECFKAFDEIISSYGIEKIKTIGDAYMAVSGLPIPDRNHAEKVVEAGLKIKEFMAERRKKLGDRTFTVRIGIHSGPVIAGIVGVRKFVYDIWGDTVNIAARMEQNCSVGQVNISEATYRLIKDKFNCSYRGEVEAKNKGLLKMYFVEKETTAIPVLQA